MTRKWPVILLAILAGCARPKPQPSAADTPSLRALGQSVAVEDTYTDETVGFEIRRRLSAEIPGESAGVIVEVNDNAVTLRGFAPNPTAMFRIEAIVHSVKGVKSVRDQLVVRTPPALP